MTWNDGVREILAEQYTVMVEKQSDYGKDNIADGGELGVFAKIRDKFKRLENLLASGKPPKNESLDDTYGDLLNYALIALMLRRGMWDLSFAEDDTDMFATGAPPAKPPQKAPIEDAQLVSIAMWPGKPGVFTIAVTTKPKKGGAQ